MMQRVPVEFWQWHEFTDRKALAISLADKVAEALRVAIRSEDKAVLAVSGGTTPKLFFNELSKADLPWEKVHVLLCDERYVPPSSPRSNAQLVKAELLINRAAAATFFPLYRETASIAENVSIVQDDIGWVPFPVDAAILGMGLDGHTASYFPDAVDLNHALDPNTLDEVVSIHAPSAEEPRLTLTLPMISTSWNTYLHIEGAQKRKVFERSMATEPALPIRTVVCDRQTDNSGPVQVYWAP